PPARGGPEPDPHNGPGTPPPAPDSDAPPRAPGRPSAGDKSGCCGSGGGVACVRGEGVVAQGARRHGGSKSAEPALAAGRAGIPTFPAITPSQPALLLNYVVRRGRALWMSMSACLSVGPHALWVDADPPGEDVMPWGVLDGRWSSTTGEVEVEFGQGTVRV